MAGHQDILREMHIQSVSIPNFNKKKEIDDIIDKNIKECKNKI